MISWPYLLPVYTFILLSVSFEKKNIDIVYKNFKNVKKSTKSDTITNVQSPTMIVKCRISFPCASKRVDTAYLNPKSRGYRSVTQKNNLSRCTVTMLKR